MAPPYTATAPWSSADGEAPPGSILHGAGPSALGILGSLTLAVRASPWVIPAMSFPPDEVHLEPLLDLLAELRHRVVVVPGDMVKPASNAAVISAVRRRAPPEGAWLADYVSARLRVPQLREPLVEQFEEALRGIPATERSIATYSRLFARYGHYTAQAWRALARLAYALSVRASCAPVADGLVPIRRDRTINRYARRFLGMSLTAAGKRLGWEWVLQLAMQRGGYLADSRMPAGEG